MFKNATAGLIWNPNKGLKFYKHMFLTVKVKMSWPCSLSLFFFFLFLWCHAPILSYNKQFHSIRFQKVPKWNDKAQIYVDYEMFTTNWFTERGICLHSIQKMSFNLPVLRRPEFISWPSCAREINYQQGKENTESVFNKSVDEKLKEQESKHHLHCSNELSQTKKSLSLCVCNCPDLAQG